MSGHDSLLRFTRKAMATVFELVICHDDRSYAHQAAEAAFAELVRLEADLSRFISNSDVSQLNAAGRGQVALVSEATYDCLEIAEEMRVRTEGAFNVNYRKGSGAFGLRPGEVAVEVPAGPLALDLGGIGKGFALDRMAETLREWEIDNALLQGGQSTVLAIGERCWPVDLRFPAADNALMQRLDLMDVALSSSGLYKGLHIVDPCTQEPIGEQRGTWVLAKSAAVADALSTAFIVMTPEQIEVYCEHYPETSALQACLGDGLEKRYFGCGPTGL